jgi:hypothetical protein
MSDQQQQPTVSDYASIERKKWVMQQYLAGRYPYQIAEEYMEVYQLSKPSFDKDVQWVNNQLRKKGQQDVEQVIERHIDIYYDNLRIAKEKGDIRSANQSLKQIEDLLKLHKPNTANGNGVNIQVNQNSINLPKLSVDEIRSLLGRGHEPLTVTIPVHKTEDNSGAAENADYENFND